MKKSTQKRLHDIKTGQKLTTQEVADIATYGQEVIPILQEARLEENLANEIMNKWFSSVLDITKAIIVITIPALVAVLNINFQNINKQELITTLEIVLLVSVASHLLTLALQIMSTRHLLYSSVARTSVYSALIQTHQIKRKLKELNRDIEIVNKQIGGSKKT